PVARTHLPPQLDPKRSRFCRLVEESIAMPFAALGLMPELTRALADRGYVEPTPVQSRVIPEILDGRDILAGAQTGTGKTAGFTLPILQRLHANAHPPKAPRALVLVPTRELAAQVNESVRSYGKYLRL